MSPISWRSCSVSSPSIFKSRPADHSRTFGYQRAGVLAAFINAGTLIVISLWIAVEAIHRLSAPVAVQPQLMMIVAAAGVVMNGVIAALLWGVARDVNLRSAFLHMAGDTLSTAAVIAGGAGILLTGHNWIDPVLSLLIAALILWSSIGIVRETLNILLEGTPRGISLPEIRSGMEAVEGVVNVHDLHVWSLGSHSRALACHVTIADIPPSESACILVKLNHMLRDHYFTSAIPPSSSNTSAAANWKAAWCPWKNCPAAPPRATTATRISALGDCFCPRMGAPGSARRCFCA